MERTEGRARSRLVPEAAKSDSPAGGARGGHQARHHPEASPTWALSVGWEEAGQEQQHDPEQQPESHVCGGGGGAPGCGSVRAGGKRAQSPEGP